MSSHTEDNEPKASVMPPATEAAMSLRSHWQAYINYKIIYATEIPVLLQRCRELIKDVGGLVREDPANDHSGYIIFTLPPGTKNPIQANREIARKVSCQYIKVAPLKLPTEEDYVFGGRYKRESEREEVREAREAGLGWGRRRGLGGKKSMDGGYGEGEDEDEIENEDE